mgnify:CR=1
MSKILKLGSAWSKIKGIKNKFTDKMIEVQAPATTRILDYLHKKPNIANFIHGSLQSDDPSDLKRTIPMAVGSAFLPSERKLKHHLLRSIVKSKRALAR